MNVWNSLATQMNDTAQMTVCSKHQENKCDCLHSGYQKLIVISRSEPRTTGHGGSLYIEPGEALGHPVLQTIVSKQAQLWYQVLAIWWASGRICVFISWFVFAPSATATSHIMLTCICGLDCIARHMGRPCRYTARQWPCKHTCTHRGFNT